MVELKKKVKTANVIQGFSSSCKHLDSLIPSPAFGGSGQQVSPGRHGFPELPQGGNVRAVLGLVVTLHEQPPFEVLGRLILRICYVVVF